MGTFQSIRMVWMSKVLYVPALQLVSHSIPASLKGGQITARITPFPFFFAVDLFCHLFLYSNSRSLTNTLLHDTDYVSFGASVLYMSIARSTFPVYPALVFQYFLFTFQSFRGRVECQNNGNKCFDF